MHKLILSRKSSQVCRVWHFSTRSPVCKGKIAGVQVCITTNFWCAGVHQTIVVQIWESYCAFLHFNDIPETLIDEYFCLQNLFASRLIFLYLKCSKIWSTKRANMGLAEVFGAKVEGMSRACPQKISWGLCPQTPRPIYILEEGVKDQKYSKSLLHQHFFRKFYSTAFLLYITSIFQIRTIFFSPTRKSHRFFFKRTGLNKTKTYLSHDNNFRNGLCPALVFPTTTT